MFGSNFWQSGRHLGQAQGRSAMLRGSLGHLPSGKYNQKWPVQPKEAAAVKRVGLVLFRRRQKPRRLVGKRRPASLVCPQKGELDQ